VDRTIVDIGSMYGRKQKVVMLPSMLSKDGVHLKKCKGGFVLPLNGITL